MKYLYFCLFFLLLKGEYTWAQTDFYDNSSIREIRMYFFEPNWDYILDSFYVAGQEERLLANIIVDGVTFDSVGIRYKGFSSVSVNRRKNPFNIKLDHVKKQSYQGIDKIKLGNVIQDPSFLREVLSYEICRKYMPASEANYANVYINDTLWGLYSNVETVDKPFVAEHFGSKNNSFFKCNPENLNLFGENANLGNSPGTDSTSYYPYYSLESNSGWGDLYQLINVLNNNPNNIEQVLNVDRTLWMHAFNYSLINFDSYVGYAQNYYLYQDHHGQFNPIIWDLNMSFASYRLADASIHYSGFSIQEAKEMDPLLHHNNVSVYPRPLMRNLFANDRYRKMYMAHIRTIMEENFANQDYKIRAQALQTLINNSVANDSLKFYSYTSFVDNLNSTVSDLVDYPGITDLMDARVAYLNSYPGYQAPPTISNINSLPSTITLGGTVAITAQVSNADTVILAYRYGANELFQKAFMLDDGSQNDGAAGDGIWGFQLTGIGNEIQYYIYAENDSAGIFAPQRAAYEYYTLQGQIIPGSLVINEFMSSNSSIVMDENGDYDDWIELYNNSAYTINTSGLYLSDTDTMMTQWTLPSYVIPAGGYLIIWADSDTLDGALHANFKLSSSGEQIVLSNSNGQIIDSTHYAPQNTDEAMARYPNGTGAFVVRTPTFNANNDYTSILEVQLESGFKLYPNPTSSVLYVELNELEYQSQLELMDMNGRVLYSQTIEPYTNIQRIQLQDYSSGMYLVRLIYNNAVETKKVILQK